MLEAAEWLTRRTGEAWTARDVLSAVTQHASGGSPVPVAFSPHALAAGPWHNLPGFDARHPTEETRFSLGPGTMASLLPRYAADILATGGALASQCGVWGEPHWCVTLAPGVRVTLDDLRVADAELQGILARSAQATAPTWDRWLRSELWSLRQAAYLLCGLEPRDETPFRTQDRDAGGPVGRAYEALKNTTLKGTLAFLEMDGTLDRRRVEPADAVEWGVNRKMPIPEELLQLMRAAPPRDGQSASSESVALDPTRGGRPMKTRELAQAFDGIVGRDAPGWAKLLGDASACQWALPARLDPGARGKRPATWDPVAFALLLERLKDVPRSQLKRRFRAEPLLAEWREVWGRKIAELEAFGLDANDRQR